MSLVRDVRNFSNLVRSLGPLLRTRVTVDTATAELKERLDKREENFLTTVERGIFASTENPYRALFSFAGCGLGDLRQMVRTKGLETTLHALRTAGVYLTFDEFKGRQPVIRGRATINVSPGHFRNPAIRQHLWTESGGTTGAPTRMSWSLARVRRSASYAAIRQAAYGITGLPKARWRGLMPREVNSLLSGALIGAMPERWFTPQTAVDLRMSWRRYPVATYALLGAIRWHGIRAPWPEHVPLESAHVVARWAADKIRTHGGCYISATASMSLRVCLAAKAEGIDLTGARFSAGSEPMTPAKVAGITDVGAICWPGYFASGIGAIGMSCAHPSGANDQHLFEDAHALIQVTRPVPGASTTVDAFNVTTLVPTATNVFVNLELDDYGVVETRRCGCLFESLGLKTHVRDIRSFRKLTGEGVSLVGTDMARVLEEVLPRTFGGSALDYQLSEDEDDRGFTRLTIVVSPRVRLPDDAAVVNAVLAALSSGDASADYARVAWQQAGTFRVARREPQWSARGKFPLIRVSKERKAG